MIKNKKLLIISSLIIISLGVFWFLKKTTKDVTPPFQTSKPQRKDLAQYVTASGTLKPKKQIAVGSLVAGRVIKIHVDNNDFVKKDQILAELDDGIGGSAIKKFKAALKEAKANLDYYEKFYKRQKKLFEAEQISQDLFEQYTKNLEVFKTRVIQITGDLEIRQQEYDNLFIRSPEDGVIIAKQIDLGMMITSRLDAKILFFIAKDLKKMEAYVDVDEADIGMVQEGQQVIFKVDAFPKLKFKSKIEQIRYLARMVNNVITYATILDVNNPDLKLRPGMTTNVDIKVAQAKNALVICNKALRIDYKQLKETAKKLDYKFEKIPGTNSKTSIDHVWILEDKEKFKQIPIKLGVREGKYTQIISDKINNNTTIITELRAPKRENIILKQIFSRQGIGSKK